MMFLFCESAEILTSKPPNKPRVIDTAVLRELKSAGVRPALFSVQADINLEDWRTKRDAIMNETIWNSGRMKPFCFPMTAGFNSQTIVLPTATSLLDLKTLTGLEKESYLHEVEFANATVIVSLGTILFKKGRCCSPTVLFARS